MRILFLTVALAALPAWGCTTASISGTDLASGKSIQLTPSPEKPVVAVFLSTVCPCSKSHEASLKTLAKRYPKFDWVGIHANQSESAEQGKQHFSNASLGFPVIRDEQAVLANELSALKTPHVFVLNGSGTCLYRGGVDASHAAQEVDSSFLNQALLAVSQNKTPDPTETRVLGCMIDR